MKKEKEIKDPIKEHFSKMGKKSWEARKKRIIEKAKVEIEKSNSNLG